MELNDDLDKDYEDYAQTFDDSERDNEDDNGDDDNDDDDDLQSMCACVELTKTALPSEIGGGVAQPCINFIIFTYLHIYIFTYLHRPRQGDHDHLGHISEKNPSLGVNFIIFIIIVIIIITILITPSRVTWGTYRRRTPLLE